MPDDKKYLPKVLRRSTTREIRGLRYHVSEWGAEADPLLVFLHGWGDAGACFQFVVDEFRGSFRAIAPDWRGFGDSGGGRGGYWFPDYLADLHELLEAYSPGQPVRLIGHSMGANVAGLYAGVFPERVAALVNIEGFGMPDSDPRNAPANYRAWIEKSRSGPVWRTYNSLSELSTKIRAASPRLPDDRALFVASQWAREEPDGSVRIKADPAHRLPNPVQYRRAEAIACWSRVNAPVLVLAGDESQYAEAMKSWIEPPQEKSWFAAATSLIIGESGHMLHFEQPAKVARAIERFLADL